MVENFRLFLIISFFLVKKSIFLFYFRKIIFKQLIRLLNALNEQVNKKWVIYFY